MPYTLVALNRYFIITRSIKNFYTSREKYIAKLEAAFKDTIYTGQKIFVIYRIAGYRKIELVLKYTQDYI
jgi:hypothetical protein